MSRKKQRMEGKGALEIIEETTHLIRNLPAEILILYYAGSLPFVLGFLYFWADMSRNPFARNYNAESAFIVAVLFLWMKSWQTVFAVKLRTIISGEPEENWSLPKIGRMITQQALFQPTGLVVLPVSLIITIPFGWTYAFYQNITVLGGGKKTKMRSLYMDAVRNSAHFPGQNHLVLLILSLFWIFVFLNVVSILYLTPYILNSFFGVETIFHRAGWSMINSTFLAISWSITYLIVDPFVKGVYLLRTFYRESISSGVDLKADLKKLRISSRTLIVLILFTGISLNPINQVMAETIKASKKISNNEIFAGELDDSIDEIIKGREYQWRMPKIETKKEKTKGFLSSFIDEVMKTVSKWIEDLFNWLKDIFELLAPDKEYHKQERYKSFPIQYLIYLLLFIAISVLAIFGWRSLKKNRATALQPEEQITAPAPDISNENVSADELPANRWLEMGRDLMEKGNLRFALRAFYLASLSHLATQNMISIASFKSNREYENELRRKAHTLPDLVNAFSINVRTFEEIWYGMHDVTNEIVMTFEVNQNKIMVAGES